MERSLFTKIIDRDIPATIEYEDDSVIAIRDIAPVAPIHILIISKKPLSNINSLTPEDHVLIGHIFGVAQQLATKFNIAGSGYRVITNVNDDGGQSVPHLHFHLLGGQALGRMTSDRAAPATSALAPSSATGASAIGASAIGASATVTSHRMIHSFWRDLAVFIVAAIGLAYGYNEMNPKHIKWVRPVYTHDTLSMSATHMPGSTKSSDNSANAVNDAANAMNNAPVRADNASNAVNDAAAAVNHPIQHAVDTAKVPPAAPCFVAQSGVVKEISYDQFVMFLKKPCITLIDARIPESYQKGHIGNAININGTEAESPDVIQRLIQFERKTIILIYCDGGECELSHRVAEVLKNFGYGPIYIYTGGWAEWSKKKG